MALFAPEIFCVLSRKRDRLLFWLDSRLRFKKSGRKAASDRTSFCSKSLV
ncbi:hypothetical protein H6G81_34505 [Scytonema hofmannii FACHB-248]|uniref:Transposase n=1 Tax=Scytonema hofmannii FACHB-248 TaxID=1842502 RepID=A0ABR8H187_9CYAN|nr:MULTISPECIES: hypothetical protein [Nostocales]MBD2609468.1 hypothetical protein [Scytonema hofmannii FACHB-248]